MFPWHWYKRVETRMTLNYLVRLIHVALVNIRATIYYYYYQ